MSVLTAEQAGIRSEQAYKSCKQELESAVLIIEIQSIPEALQSRQLVSTVADMVIIRVTRPVSYQ